ncbi:MAG: septum formation initiator family protein [Pelagibacteraceae bacterium]|jgi:cell division protein FtsB|nr:septum formation initiator family protein [Pelagibacteraceae bacterium]|tara:strand:- start:9284 stop:9580 length:297 start_codon:yes stop_codon:yes gene_type:complete
MKLVEVLKKNYFLLVSTFFFIYIAFNFLDGERGLFSYLEKKELYNQKIQKKNNLTDELNDIEKKIFLLTENIDLDYLEILYREKFFYGKQNEKVYLNR